MNSKENALISVVIPIYNGEQYIDKCMDSLCRQTYLHLEIILIDDGSTDHSAEKCNFYAQKLLWQQVNIWSLWIVMIICILHILKNCIRLLLNIIPGLRAALILREA